MDKLIRNIPDDIAAVLKQQAKSFGLTFEAYLRLKLIELAKETKNMTTYTFPVGSDQAARINLDEHAAQCGTRDARELEGEFDIQAYANELVDQALENEELTDDPEEYRARFVGAYVKAFQETRFPKMTLRQALEVSDYNEATMIDQNGFRVTITQESKRIRVSEGPDGGFAQLQNDIRTMDQFKEYYPEFYASDQWEAVGEADS